MADLVEIKTQILEAEEYFAQAKKDEDQDMILMYGNNLAMLRREKNYLEAIRAGESIFSFHFFLFKKNNFTSFSC
jgi:hypothetical protein